MKRLSMAVAFTFILSAAVYAGDIPCGNPAPAPDPTTQSTESPSPAEIPISGITTPGDIPCGDAVLSAILAVFGLVTG
jgi:hypothetical protein